ncbi:MAG: hypothetical protein P9M14_07640 [Candidatus Alcyoniella australis]|nr:hypothetical protein [Candidatus Alcyoniella australis]
MIKDKSKKLGELLLERGLIDSKQLEKALDLQKISTARLGSLLTKIKAISEVELLSFLSLYFDCPYFDLRGFHAQPDVLATIPSEVARKYRILPIAIEEPKEGAAELVVGTNDPTNLDAMYQASRASGYNVNLRVVSDHEMAAALLRHYSPDARPEIMALAQQIQGLEAEVMAELLGLLAEKGIVDIDLLFKRLRADSDQRYVPEAGKDQS